MTPDREFSRLGRFLLVELRGARGELRGTITEERIAAWLAAILDWCMEAGLWLMALPWFVLGWLAGALAWLIVFIGSAVVAGFRAGYGAERGEE